MLQNREKKHTHTREGAYIGHKMRLHLLLLTVLILAGCTRTSTPASAPPGAVAAPPTPVQGSASIPPTGTPTAPPAQITIATAEPAITPMVQLTATSTAILAQPAPSAVPPTPPTTTAQPIVAEVAYSYPIGMPGRPGGDGFFIRHSFAAENTWFNPGHWHTGEDWYALEGDTAGAEVYAIATGEVVYVGANYPGRVVIIQHAADLFSIYGHLDPAVAVQSGQAVVRGELLGTVLRRNDTVPNHLHFEVRTFLTTREVNGAAPRYGFRCGVECPPGPGYWPIAAPDHPSDLGWRNPTHVIARRAFPPDGDGLLGAVIVATQPVSSDISLWSAPPRAGTAGEAVATVGLQPGARFALLGIWAGPEDSQLTSAQAYDLWYRIALPDGRAGWAQAAVASDFETGSDARPATIRFNLFPVTTAAAGAPPPGPSSDP